ncbi:hypothetical protein [Lacticaseibacillus sharpeae]|uniref:hypothetical protein n=1 Tax=Lacticaseibacillus sharpeae TaxID=1626 RepID=UPI000AB259EE|nr:hypothetical protein [Lacticaseibacillus sharpeae]
MSAAFILIPAASVNHEENNMFTVDTFSKEELLQRHNQSERFRLTLKDRLAGEQNLAPALDEFIELESQMLVADDAR